MNAAHDHCARCQSPLEGGDLRCPICCLPVPAQGTAVAKPTVRVQRCVRCGATLEYDVNVQAPRCAFCTSVVVLEVSQDPIEQPEFYLPFHVAPLAARAALVGWLSQRRFFSPSDVLSASTLAALTPLWWVAWCFQVEALVSWTADSNAGAGRSAWAPHAGQTPMSLTNVIVSASRGLSSREAMALIPAFDLRGATPAPQPVAGVPTVFERFDVQRSTARRIISDSIQRLAAGRAGQLVPGSQLRNLSVAVLLRSLATRRLALPSYVLAYRYRNKLYRVVVHGQDARYVIGDRPVSIWKISALGAAVLALVLLYFFLQR